MSENKNFKKKVVDPCPNKLFIAWIGEAKRIAKNNRDKSYFSYKKALQSLKRFPLPLKSGKDCILLEGFGAKTCEFLDKKLKEFAKSQEISTNKALQKGNKEFSKNPKTKSSDKSLFIVKKGECYALLFGLHELQNKDSSVEFMGSMKKDICQSALKYYTISLESNTVEKLWKAMPKLLKYDLVTIDGTRYQISTLGKKILSQLSQANGTQFMLSDNELIDMTNNDEDGTESNESLTINSKLPSIEPINMGLTQMKQMQFFFCKSLSPHNDEFAHSKSDAAVKILNGEKYVRVKIKYDELINCDIDYQNDMDALSSEDNYVFVFLLEKDSPDICSYVEKTKGNQHLLSGKPVVAPKTDKTSSQKTKKSNKRTSNNSIESTWKVNKIKRNSTTDDIDLKNVLLKSSLLSNHCETATVEDSCLSKIHYKMPIGSFEVVLIVDNRENFGTGKLRERLCPELAKKGIKFETRVLSVGDFAWIARDYEGREAVLDIIIERKTYADLAKSVIDNRFKDQKLRMKRSGFSKIIYLLENCKGMKNLSLTVDSLHQAVINSERYDNCDVKIAENAADSILFLVTLTKKICAFYSNVSLNVYRDSIPKECRRFNPFDVDVNQFSAIDFASFAESGQKTKPIRFSEMFAKHLCCITGMSIEKAKAVIDRFPTPRLLMEAYEKCGNEKDRQTMLSSLKLVSNKSLGAHCSKIIYAAYSRK